MVRVCLGLGGGWGYINSGGGRGRWLRGYVAGTVEFGDGCHCLCVTRAKRISNRLGWCGLRDVGCGERRWITKMMVGRLSVDDDEGWLPVSE